MCDVGDGVERPTSDFVLSKFLTIVDIGIGGFETEVEEPVDKCQEPNKPEGNNLSELSLEVTVGWGGVA